MASFIVLTGVAIAFVADPSHPDKGLTKKGHSLAAPVARSIEVNDQLVPPHQEPPPSPSPKPSAAAAIAAPRPKPAQSHASVPKRDLQAYRGLGAWVDVYDYALRDRIDPAKTMANMASHGVKTLYLETARWKDPNDFVDIGLVGEFVDQAHKRGIKVVGWYLPGFGDMEKDLRRSVAVLKFATASGGRFDGFAADIESREELGGDLQRFDAGIAEYSQKLRQRVGTDTAIGGIVVDAKNNERAPERWAGFPWPEIGKNYDVVMSMAYWSVTKKSGCGVEYDVDAYMKDVITKTEALMGVKKPIHPIGGIADCTTVQEVASYVASLKAAGALGGSLYDYVTTERNSLRDALWQQLSPLNAL